MKLRDIITAGVKPLAQNRLRAGLSILGIFIGIAGVLCMIAIGDGGKRSSPKISKNLVVQISSQSLRSTPVSNADGSSDLLLSDIPLKTLLRLRQNAPKYYMFCPIMKILKSWLPTEMGIKPGSF